MEVFSGNSDSYYRSSFILLELSHLVPNNLVYDITLIGQTTSSNSDQDIYSSRLHNRTDIRTASRFTP